MNPQIQQLKGLMNQIKAAQNPQMMLNQMLVNDPRFASIIDVIKNNGGDPKTAFFNLCKQQGIDPQAILNQLK